METSQQVGQSQSLIATYPHGSGRVRDATTRMLWLYPSLVVPSLFTVDKFLGPGATLGYAVLTGIAVVLSARVAFPTTRREEIATAIALFTIMVVGFAILYPIANVHVPGAGTDEDDAHNIAARALLAGRSPYHEQTYLGNVLHELPGSDLLALPFVLLWTSALQNLFWIPAFFAAARAGCRDGRAMQLAILTLASPAVAHEIAVGVSYLSNAIYVLLGLWWLTRTRRRALASVAWGVALASRFNFLFLLPLAFGWIKQRSGWRAALCSAALTLAAFTALTLPFYLADPQHFAPLNAADRVTRFDALFPHAGILIVVAMGVLAMALAVRPMQSRDLFRSAALVQAFPVAAGGLFGFLRSHTWDLAYLTYGMFAAWFAYMGWLQPTAAAPARES